MRPGAEGRWLKRGGVQSDYAKLCPYVLAWKFHPSPGLPPGLGKCIYCCLSSVLYIAVGSASETGRGTGGWRGEEGGTMDRGVLLEVEVEKKLPGDGHDDAEYKFQRRSHLRSRRSGPSAPTEPLYSFLGFSIRKADA